MPPKVSPRSASFRYSWGQGGHVRRDLPLLIAQLQQAHPTLQFKVATAVGEDDAVLQAIARYCIVSAGI